MVDPAPKSPLHLSSIFGGRPLPRSSRVDGDDAGADPQDLSAQTMVPLAVVGSVGEDPIPGDQLRRLPQSGVETGSIIAGTVADMAPDPQVRTRVTQDGQLRPEGAAEALGAWPLVDVVEAGVTYLKTRRINCTGRLIVD